MNALGIALVWCAVQVTLVGLLAGGMYLIARRLRPAAGTSVTLAALVIIVGLSAMALSPWPRWSFGGRTGEAEAAISDRTAPAPAPEEPRLAGQPDQPLLEPSAVAGQNEAEQGPSLRALFFQALLDELSGATSLGAEAAWRWPAVLAAAFLVAAGLATAWLLAGLLAVGAYRTRSQPITDRGLLELADVVQAELGCRRPIELRQSDALITAATIGWRRPVVLLPADWTGWTPEQRRAVLAHEIAHVREGHFLSILCGQLGVVLHFYHPLVHWLMRRLRLEQELAADAVAAGVTGGQRKYLTAIAELALRQSDRPLVWPARSFLPTRNTFLRRVAMLRDAKLRDDRLSPAARGLLLGAVLVCAVLAAGLRGPVDSRQASALEAGQRRDTSQAAIDLSYVPSDAVAIVAIRPAAIFARPELKELAELVDTRSWGSHVTASEIEQFALVLLHRPDLSKPGPEAFGEPVVMLRFATPDKVEEAIRKEFPDLTAKEYEGTTYHVFAKGGNAAVFRPDDRTIIAGPEPDVRKVIRSRGGPLPEIIGGRKTWRAFQRDHVVAASGSLLTTFFTEMRPPGALIPLAPLWEETKTVVLGARVDRQLRLHGVAVSDNDEGAAKVEETLKAVQVLARNFMDQLRQKAGELPERERAMLSSAFAALDLVSKASVQREGNVVRAETSGDFTSLELGSFAKAIVDARGAARRSRSVNNLKQIALAMHMFHDTYKCFPPAVLHQTLGHAGESKPYSWRVALLPYLEDQQLYKQYRFDEPWDSPANLEVLKKMPAVYRHPNDPADSTDTSYFGLVGPDTVLSGKGGRPPIGGTPIAQIRDGTSNTLMVVEAKRSVPWTKPEDVPYDPEKPIPELGGYTQGGFNAAFCDGSVRFLSHEIEESVLRALIGISDGKVISVPF